MFGLYGAADQCSPECARILTSPVRRYSGYNKTLEVGQSCYYWRDARASDLVKISWRGPAVARR